MNEHKNIEFTPIGNVKSREELLEIMNNEKIKEYQKIKHDRKKQLKISEKKAQKKAVEKSLIRGALILISALSINGAMLYKGATNIVNEINANNFVNQNVYSREYSSGYQLFERKGPGLGNPTQLNSAEYINELLKEGTGLGFTQEEMAIYCEHVYRSDFGLSQGIAEELKTKFNSFVEYNNEKLEGIGRGGK